MTVFIFIFCTYFSYLSLKLSRTIKELTEYNQEMLENVKKPLKIFLIMFYIGLFMQGIMVLLTSTNLTIFKGKIGN
jgi:hypothetical protein